MQQIHSRNNAPTIHWSIPGFAGMVTLIWGIAGGCTLMTGRVAAATSVAISATTMDPVLRDTAGLFREAFKFTRSGTEVLLDLRATSDPALVPFFEQVGKSADPRLQILAMVDANYVTRNPAMLHIGKLLATTDPGLITPELAQAMQDGKLSFAQLKHVLTQAPEPAQRMMAAAELVKSHEKIVQSVLDQTLASSRPSVRYYAAMTLLQSRNPGEIKKGLSVLKQLAQKHNARMRRIKTLLLSRVTGEKIREGIPWVLWIANDPRTHSQVRLAAIRALLQMQDPSGPRLLARCISTTTDMVGRIELGLTAIEFGKALQPAAIRPLEKSDSPLLKSLAKTALTVATGKDPTDDLLSLINQGQPIFLNWVLSYAHKAGTMNKQQLLGAIIRLSTIVDGDRDQDYARGVMAAEELANDDTPADRKLLAGFLNSPQRGVVEATLAGMLRSRKRDFSPLILPQLKMLLKNRDRRISQYVALLLGREGNKQAIALLARVCRHDTERSDGFRAVAGWYYIKLTGQTDAFVKLLSMPTTRP